MLNKFFVDKWRFRKVFFRFLWIKWIYFYDSKYARCESFQLLFAVFFFFIFSFLFGSWSVIHQKQRWEEGGGGGYASLSITPGLSAVRASERAGRLERVRQRAGGAGRKERAEDAALSCVVNSSAAALEEPRRRRDIERMRGMCWGKKRGMEGSWMGLGKGEVQMKTKSLFGSNFYSSASRANFRIWLHFSHFTLHFWSIIRCLREIQSTSQLINLFLSLCTPRSLSHAMETETAGPT